MKSKFVVDFFKRSTFAVVGASKDPSKFGNKVLKSYIAHEKPVIPVHRTEKSIEGLFCAPSLSDISPDILRDVGVSIVTPPPVTREVLEEGLDLGETPPSLAPCHLVIYFPHLNYCLCIPTSCGSQFSLVFEGIKHYLLQPGTLDANCRDFMKAKMGKCNLIEGSAIQEMGDPETETEEEEETVTPGPASIKATDSA